MLAAFGIETFFRDMESDADEETVDRYFDDGRADCSTWTPTPPDSNGWRLLEIYDSEHGPYALFARAATSTPARPQRSHADKAEGDR